MMKITIRENMTYTRRKMLKYAGTGVAAGMFSSSLRQGFLIRTAWVNDYRINIQHSKEKHLSH